MLVLIMKSIRPRSMSSMTQPPRPAGVVQAAGDCQPDGRVALRREHLVGEDVAGLGEPAGVEGLEAALDQLADLGASAWPVILDWLAFKVIFGGRGPVFRARDAALFQPPSTGRTGVRSLAPSACRAGA